MRSTATCAGCVTRRRGGDPVNPTVDFLLHPAVPSALLVLWVVVWWNHRKHPPLMSEMDRRHARPGDLSRGGSKATSNTEQRVRDVIESAGFRTYPQGTLLCVGRDSDGRNRFFTPDIMLRKPRLVVEVDPAHYHGSPEKIAEDLMRNRFYASVGLKVVRVRIAGTRALSPNDVVIPESDFRPDRDGAKVIRALGAARELPPSYWRQRHHVFK